MNPFDAIVAASDAALSASVEVRTLVGAALCVRLPLACSDLVLEHLVRDPDRGVRLMAQRAIAARAPGRHS
jgi:hypothetical protein